VLYIEDNLSNMRLVERLLEHRPSFSLIVANSGAAGLEMARQHQPDLVLLDVNLPDMEGRDVMLQMRAQGPNVPVIVLSADATFGQRARLKEAGAFAYLTKPLDVQRFFEVLDRAIIEHPFDQVTTGN
jgi:CheY-like chemotaxis protein